MELLFNASEPGSGKVQGSVVACFEAFWDESRQVLYCKSEVVTVANAQKGIEQFFAENKGIGMFHFSTAGTCRELVDIVKEARNQRLSAIKRALAFMKETYEVDLAALEAIGAFGRK